MIEELKVGGPIEVGAVFGYEFSGMCQHIADVDIWWLGHQKLCHLFVLLGFFLHMMMRWDNFEDALSH